MGIKFKNDAVSVLTGGLTTLSTDILIDAADDGKFPVIAAVGADYFYLTLEDEDHNIEIVKIVRHVAGSNNLETDATADSGANRGLDGTTARTWDVGDVVEMRINALALEEAINLDDHITDPTDAHAASAITNTPAGTVAATTVQGAIDELASELVTKADTASAVMDGDTAGGELAGTYPNPTLKSIPAGTKMLFQQTNAPPGWVKDVTHNNKALRVVSGTASSGGATAFTSVFGSGKVTGGTALTVAQMPAHDHDIQAISGNGGVSVGLSNDGTSGAADNTAAVRSEGSGDAHDHTLSLDLQYVDLIIATKS